MKVIKEEGIIPGAEPFFLPAGDQGCLLIHGIAGTPQVFRQMGEFLSQSGITVSAVRLKGHATCVEDLHLCTYQDWVESAQVALHELSASCSKIFIAGLSMGGVIGLHLARLNPELVSGVITICSPYDLNSPLFKLVPLVKRFVKRVASGPPSINDPEAIELKYSHHSLPAVHELIKLTAIVREDLAHIKQPVLIFSALEDKTVHCSDGEKFYNSLASREKEIIRLERSQHIATLDYDKDLLFQKTADFIKRNSE